MKKVLAFLILPCFISAYGQVEPGGPVILNQGVPLGQGLVGFWLANEGAGTTIQDLSGYGNTGTFFGDTTWVPGKFGPCLGFGGAGSVDVGEGDNMTENMSALTISVWANTPLTSLPSGIMDLVAQETSPPSVFRLMFHTYENSAIFDVRNAADNLGQAFYANVFGSAYEWYHIVGVYNGTNVSVYKNAKKGGTVANLTGLTATSTHNIRVGSDSSGGEDLWIGSIDNVMIYNRALNAEEIQQLYRDPFCMFRREPTELYVTAEAPPEGNPQVIMIMMSSLPAILIVGIAASFVLVGKRSPQLLASLRVSRRESRRQAKLERGREKRDE